MKNQKTKVLRVIISSLLVLAVTFVAGVNTVNAASTRHSVALAVLADVDAISGHLKDDRAERLNAYFAKRDMPLYGYGEKFVEVADKYDMDWRLLPAIGVRESSGGKHMMNNNPFGWGSAKIPFKNFDESIEEVGSNISGNDEDTNRYYGTKSIYKKLWYYNGTVMPSYPNEVIAIMNLF